MEHYRVSLFGGFNLRRDGTPVAIPPETQRLVAFLCVHDDPLERTYVAGRLWGDCDEERSRANLRSSLWRLRRAAERLLVADASTIGLAPAVGSDVLDMQRQASILWGDDAYDPAALDRRTFARELLPGWYDDWVVVERERMRQLCLHCLEATADALRRREMFGAAIQALITAITLDPLRESPQRQLMAVHLAEGNRSEAVRQYHEFAELLDHELGLAPSPAMLDLLAESGVQVSGV